jgi:hypothetical protein
VGKGIAIQVSGAKPGPGPMIYDLSESEKPSISERKMAVSNGI